MNSIKLAIAIAMSITATSRISTANTGPTSWSAPATSCRFASTTGAQPPSFDYTYGEVGFAAGDKGTLHLVCPIPTTQVVIADPSQMQLAYNAQPGCSVTATLRSHSRNGTDYGSLGTIAVVGSGMVAPYFSTQYVNFTGDWDPDDNVYWVDLSVTKSEPSETYCTVNTISVNSVFF